mmetsp:Transcript_127/g.168  ORF Transcript_127/g.168 Transcript_127/m.168 type:complete len:95 (-) Transcript_127:471-755(-)
MSSANWDDIQRKVFIEAMVDETNRGNFTDGGFKVASWNRIAEVFNAATGLSYTKSQLQNQYAILKNKFNIFRDLKNKFKRIELWFVNKIGLWTI